LSEEVCVYVRGKEREYFTLVPAVNTKVDRQRTQNGDIEEETIPLYMDRHRNRYGGSAFRMAGIGMSTRLVPSEK
jgi:hypothetical protein